MKSSNENVHYSWESSNETDVIRLICILVDEETIYYTTYVVCENIYDNDNYSLSLGAED